MTDEMNIVRKNMMIAQRVLECCFFSFLCSGRFAFAKPNYPLFLIFGKTAADRINLAA